MAAPRIDLRFAIDEHPTFIDSCNGSQMCQTNLPGAPVGAGHVWSTPSWEIERIITAAALAEYDQREFDKCYIRTIGCQARVAVGRGQAPTGWTTFDVVFDLGNPPEDQYLWELISEVAQVALHRFSGQTVPEGDAGVAFTVEDVDVGLRAAQIREAVRPYLQQQASTISARLLGDWSRNNGALDFYYRRGADGAGYLFYIAPQDPRPMASYDYATPGFFADEALTQPIGATDMPSSGDTTHIKLPVGAGEQIVFVQDDAGDVYRLRIRSPRPGAAEITAGISRKLRQGGP